MSKSSKEAWTWERKPGESQVWCSYCGGRVLKSHSFGSSYRYRQVWHTECASGPKDWPVIDKGEDFWEWIT